MRRNFSQLYVHLVWATWDRLPLMTHDVLSEVRSVIAYECQRMRCPVIALGGIDNHVHLLASFPPSVAIATLVKQVKGSSSHSMTHQIKPGSFFKWQGSYAAFTVNRRDLETVASYIANQAEHHRRKTCVSDWELEDWWKPLPCDGFGD